MRDVIILGYAATVGFVAAGIIASFYTWMTSEPARFGLLGRGVLALATTFVFCALTGPVIIVENAFRLRRQEEGAAGWMFAGFFIAALWSSCSGILVLSLVFSLRHSLA